MAHGVLMAHKIFSCEANGLIGAFLSPSQHPKTTISFPITPQEKDPPMPQSIDYYFSFRSPYSYLSTVGALGVGLDFDVLVRFRPVLPLALRKPEFFAGAMNQAKILYILRDWPRRAEMLGLPHHWPRPDPIVQDFATFKIAEEQPYIHNLVFLGIEAEQRGRGVEFAAEVAKLIWGGTENWHQGDHLASAAARAGLDYAAMLTAIEDPTSHQKELEQNHTDQAAAGHEGVPLFVLNGEPFFGQDRIDSLRFQLEKDGLKKTA